MDGSAGFWVFCDAPGGVDVEPVADDGAPDACGCVNNVSGGGSIAIVGVPPTAGGLMSYWTVSNAVTTNPS